MRQAMVEFALVAGAMTLVPGLDFTFVLRAALTQSRRGAFAAGLGIATGLLLWAIAASLGLSAILAASPVAFSVLQTAGAGYLIYLGISYWRSSRATINFTADNESIESPTRLYRRGLMTNALNPKICIFYLAVLPPFIPSDVQPVLAAVALASVHVVECLLYFTLTIAAAQTFKRRLSSAVWRERINRISGALIVGFGIRLLSEAAR